MNSETVNTEQPESLEQVASYVLGNLNQILDGKVTSVDKELEEVAFALHLESYQLSEENKTDLISKLESFSSRVEDEVFAAVIRLIGFLRIDPSIFVDPSNLEEHSEAVQTAFVQASLNASIDLAVM